MKYKDITKLKNCPECNSNWVSGIITKEYREFYSPPYFYSRVLGIELLHEDRIHHWVCPDCKHEFPRDY